MSIGKEQALAVFHQRYPPGTIYSVEITDILPAKCNVHIRPTDCWFVLFSHEEFVSCLQSSRLVAISKQSGEVVYDGDAGRRIIGDFFACGLLPGESSGPSLDDSHVSPN